MKKKILWIVLLAAIVLALIVGIVLARKSETINVNNTLSSSLGKSIELETKADNEKNTTNSSNVENDDSELVIKEDTTKGFKKTVLSDGILYSKDGKQVKSDIVISDNYFDTTINDIWLNPDSYKNKKIEIEGMYLENLPYTFVGRYSVSNLCPNCPPGYSYFEYQLNENLGLKLTDGEDWIKIIGTLQVGNDETSDYQDYYYLDVLSLEIMNERGLETVTN